MTELLDTLVTQLEYTADTKVIDAADKKLKALEKQSLQTARATDKLADDQIRLKEKLQRTTEQEQKLRREQVKLRKEIKAAKKPTDDQRKALARVDQQLEDSTRSAQKFRNELGRLGIVQAKLSRQQRTAARQQQRLGGATKGARGRAAEASSGGGLEGLAAAGGPVTAALAGVAAAATGAAVAVGTVVETGARMETLRARLKTVEGGVEEAAQAFSLLRSIAVETPFELEDVTNAYVRLKALGIQPTEKSLKAFGNVAAAQGKPIIDFIEAVADASTNEFERLKEFGIKASSQGEQVAFTFGGVTTKVRKDAKEITKFLEGLGETAFAGAMADQMNTFAGLISNLKDRWTGFLDQISQLGVLDEVKAIVTELSDVMGEDLAPIIADVMIGLLRQVRDLIVFLKGDSGDLTERMQGLTETLELIGTILQPFIMLWKATVSVFGVLVGITTTLHGLLNSLFDILGRIVGAVVDLIMPSKELGGEWEGLSNAWAAIASGGDKLVGTITAITNAMFGQAGSLESVNNAIKQFQDLTGAGSLKSKTDAELQELRAKGGKEAEQANKEIRRRVKERETSEKQQDADAKKQALREKKEGRAGKVAGDFDSLNDRQLASFASDPNVSKKLRDKAEKEQKKRAKKRSKKGAAAGKKLAGATLIADINKQFDKNARELAQAETARGLQSGKLDSSSAGAFETKRFKEIRDKQKRQFEDTGKLPAGIAQDVRQTAALPSIANLAGRTAAPVISNTINNFDFHDNEFNSILEGGTFEGTPQTFAAGSLANHRKLSHKAMGEAVSSFRSNELR